MSYLLHLTFPSGSRHTVTCTSAFTRGLLVIALAEQRVDIRIEDVAVRS